MLHHDECIAKAVELEEMATHAVKGRADYLEMALSWRHMAEQAKYQDSFETTLGQSPQVTTNELPTTDDNPVTPLVINRPRDAA
jgi:hypothetical protein